VRAVRSAAIRWTLGIAVACGPHLAAAQGDCISHLPASAFTRTTVYLEAEAVDTTGRPMLRHVDLLTQSVASRLRRSLGSDEERVPTADSVIDWQRLDASLVLSVYSDGRFSWRRDPERVREDTASRPSRQLIERALTVTQDSGERVYVPEGAIRDSMLFRVSYTHATVSESGQVTPLPVRVAFPVFTLPMPRMKPALTIREPRVRYPAEPLNGRVEGNLILQFVVDTAGRAVMSTVRDVWPSKRPRLTGDLARYYEEFAAAAVEAIRDARFEPARIGGCPTRQLVQLPFAFKLRR
jgi:hypothetical protein